MTDIILNENAVGSIVYSKAGRDKKRCFVIVGIDENAAHDGFVYVCDGRLRKIENPKKKNLRHLEIVKTGGGVFTEKIINGKVADCELQNYIAAFESEKR